MKIALTAAGIPLLAGGQVFQLGAVVVTPPPTPTPGAPLPLASIAGWWDSTTVPVGAVFSIADSSVAAKSAAVVAQAGTPKLVPHTAGLLPGIFGEGNASNYSVRQPVLTSYAVNAANISVGAGGKLAVWLVWSRPAKSQPDGSNYSSLPVNLLQVNGVTVLQLSSSGTADTLKLFPAGAAVVAGSFPLRHTRGVLVQFDGAIINVWLDTGALLFSTAANEINLGATASLSFLSNAGMIFHEGGAYSKALDSTERAAWVGYVARWPMGARSAAHTLVIGQSNAANIMGPFFPLIGKSLAYMTGAVSANMLGTINLPGPTTFSGTGLYGTADASLILDSTGGGDPSTWPLGGNGITLMASVDAMTADDRDNITSIFWFWTESLSAYLAYAQKAQAIAAHKRFFALIRAKFGRTAAELPILGIDPLPFNTTAGAQTMREVFADLVADPTQNFKMMLGSTQDAIGQGDTWNATTGIESGPGNAAHRDDTGYLAYARRLIAPLARASLAGLAARGRAEPLTTLDASLPLVGGPRITEAHYEGGSSMLVTFAHDGGTDLIVPLRAALGVGWTLMDGVSNTVSGNPGAPGNLIAATACARVNATQVRLTLASAPVNPGKAQLYYPYGTGLDASGFAVIGQGNAVTDNFSTVTLPAGWRIGQDLGASAQPNNPVQSTTYGVALT